MNDISFNKIFNRLLSSSTKCSMHSLIVDFIITDNSSEQWSFHEQTSKRRAYEVIFVFPFVQWERRNEDIIVRQNNDEYSWYILNKKNRSAGSVRR